MTVTVTEAKRDFADLLARAEEGERIAITRRGRVIAELGPVQKRKPNFEAMKRVITVIDPDWDRPQEDVEAWLRGDV